jgi:hypothetical protein
MAENQGRRRFLQTSLAAGTVLSIVGGSATQADVPARTPAPDANPAAPPGRVRWHADFAAACTASRASSKPVFLFQMMGRLDQRFC